MCLFVSVCHNVQRLYLASVSWCELREIAAMAIVGHKEAPACFLLLALLLPPAWKQHLTTSCLHTPNSRVFRDADWGSIHICVCPSRLTVGPHFFKSVKTSTMFPLAYLNGLLWKSYLTDPVPVQWKLSAVLRSHMSSVLFSHDYFFGNSRHVLAIELEFSIKYGLFTHQQWKSTPWQTRSASQHGDWTSGVNII